MIQFQNPERFVSVSFPDSFVSLDYNAKLADLTDSLLQERKSARFVMPTSDSDFLTRNYKLQLFTRFLTGSAVCLSLSFEHQRPFLVLTSNDIFPVAQYQLLRQLEQLGPNSPVIQFETVKRMIITNLFIEIYKPLATEIASQPILKDPTRISLPAGVSHKRFATFISEFNKLLQKIRSIKTASPANYPSYFAEINAILPHFERLATYHHQLSNCIWWKITDFQVSLPSLILEVNNFINSFRSPNLASEWNDIQDLISTGKGCCPLLVPACERRTTCHERSSSIHCPACRKSTAPTSECLGQFCELYNSELKTHGCDECCKIYFCHAEMKRLMLIFHDYYTSNTRNESLNPVPNPNRIFQTPNLCFVINRFTCYSCQKVFDALNSCARAEGHRLTCRTAGTHGMIFLKGTAPLAGCLDSSNRFFADNGLLHLHSVFEELIEVDSRKMLLNEEAQKTMISQVVVVT